MVMDTVKGFKTPEKGYTVSWRVVRETAGYFQTVKSKSLRQKQR